MGTLYVYNNFTPNDTGTHYYGSDSAFDTTLGAHLLTSVNMDNYRINNNQVYIAFNSQLTQSNYHSVTYLRDTTDNAYYFVDNMYLQGGYIVYTVHKDLWAMYINKALIHNIIVNRCNRNIGIGVYDQIDVYGNKSLLTYYSSSKLALSDMSLVCFVQYDPNKSELKNEKLATMAIGFKLSDIIQFTDPQAAKDNLFTFMQIFAAGIADVDFSGLWLTTQHAKLTKAFLLPNYLLNYSNKTVSVAIAGLSTVLAHYNAKIIDTSTVSITYNVTTYPDYQYYIGTSLQGMKLPRYTKNNNTASATTDLIATSVKAIIEQNDAKILMICGEDEFDISHQFIIPTALNDPTADSINDIRRMLSNAGQIVSGVVTKNYAMAAGGIVDVANHAFDIAQRDVGTITQVGVANNIYEITVQSDTLVFSQPFHVYRYNGIDNRIPSMVRLRGATFNKNVASFNDIFTFSLLGSTGVTDDTYVAADCSIDKVPTDARELIRNKLGRGIYIKQLI